MHRHTPLLLSAICLCLGAFQTSSAQEQYNLSYRFAKDKTYRVIDTIKVESNQEIMGRESNSTSTVVATTKIQPTEVADNGTTTLVSSIESLSMRFQNMQIDTTIVPRELVGQRTRLTVSKLGQTIKREVLDTVKLSGLAATTGQRELVRLHIYPGHPVKAGEKWTASRMDTSDAGGNYSVVGTTIDYTLVGKEKRHGRDQLRITFSGKLTLSGKGNTMGNDYVVEGSGKMTGTTFVNPQTGLSEADDSKTDMDLSVAVTGQQNLTIPTTQSIVTHRKLVVE
ncbi:MAG TPA: DUF6263 family protein [Bacteroidota bacterium]|nr:DUF6263 family protein [Bacteroidota bacterium]